MLPDFPNARLPNACLLRQAGQEQCPFPAADANAAGDHNIIGKPVVKRVSSEKFDAGDSEVVQRYILLSQTEQAYWRGQRV